MVGFEGHAAAGLQDVRIVLTNSILGAALYSTVLKFSYLPTSYHTICYILHTLYYTTHQTWRLTMLARETRVPLPKTALAEEAHQTQGVSRYPRRARRPSRRKLVSMH